MTAEHVTVNALWQILMTSLFMTVTMSNHTSWLLYVEDVGDNYELLLLYCNNVTAVLGFASCCAVSYKDVCN